MSIFSDKSLAYSNDEIYNFIFRLYNKEAKKYKLNPALKMTTARKIILSKYIHEYTMNDVLIILRELRKAKNFITGATWLSFDWLLKEENIIKLMEGKYRDEKFSNTEIKSKANYINRIF